MQKIKKLCITAPKGLSVQMDEIDEKNIPAGQFLIETIYSQVSAGTETACYRGMEAWFKLPGTPGYSCVGRVIAKAEDVTTVEPGDLVAAHQDREVHAGPEVLLQVTQGIYCV